MERVPSSIVFCIFKGGKGTPHKKKSNIRDRREIEELLILLGHSLSSSYLLFFLLASKSNIRERGFPEEERERENLSVKSKNGFC